MGITRKWRSPESRGMTDPRQDFVRRSDIVDSTDATSGRRIQRTGADAACDTVRSFHPPPSAL